MRKLQLPSRRVVTQSRAIMPLKKDPEELATAAAAAAVAAAQSRAMSLCRSQRPVQSPAYPGYSRPTPEECYALKAELAELHGAREQPPAPESPPELLDSLVRLCKTRRRECGGEGGREGERERGRE